MRSNRSTDGISADRSVVGAFVAAGFRSAVPVFGTTRYSCGPRAFTSHLNRNSEGKSCASSLSRGKSPRRFRYAGDFVGTGTGSGPLAARMLRSKTIVTRSLSARFDTFPVIVTVVSSESKIAVFTS